MADADTSVCHDYNESPSQYPVDSPLAAYGQHIDNQSFDYSLEVDNYSLNYNEETYADSYYHHGIHEGYGQSFESLEEVEDRGSNDGEDEHRVEDAGDYDNEYEAEDTAHHEDEYGAESHASYGHQYGSEGSDDGDYEGEAEGDGDCAHGN